MQDLPYDYILYTDGSGYEKDGFSGWCCQVVSNVPGVEGQRRMGCMSGSTVDRAEFTALLEGLFYTTKRISDFSILSSPPSQEGFREVVSSASDSNVKGGTGGRLSGKIVLVSASIMIS